MKNNYPEYSLYQVNKEVRCIKCGHKGAVKFYGTWHPNGIGNKVDVFKSDFVKNSMEKYRDNPKMSYAGGFGGTIPYLCTNCNNIGLIDSDGLEGYEKAFETIK